MRILQISSAKTFGGGERHFVDLCRALHARGHEVFAAVRPSSEWRERLDFLPADRILLVSIRNSFGMFSAKRMSRFIDERAIDIVHAHVARDYLVAGIAVRARKEAKLVLTRHVVFPLKPFHRFALRNVSAAIAVSPPVASQLEKIFPPNKVRTIANGIAMEANVPEDGASEFRKLHGIPAGDPLIVTVGELKLLKGQRDFVLAAHEVVKDVPEARFVIAGKDHSLDQRFRRELKRLVKVMGLDGRFLWLDWLDDLQPLLAAADLFVSPSHSESFGLAILDAMAAAKAVVATATDGARGLIDKPHALVPVKDPLALASAIVNYLWDDERRRSDGLELQEAANKRFGLDRMVDETVAVYLELSTD